MDLDGFRREGPGDDAAAQPYLPDSRHGLLPDPAALEDWRRAHALLLEQERTLADLAVRHSAGEISLAELDAARQRLDALRELADCVFRKVFGVTRHASEAP